MSETPAETLRRVGGVTPFGPGIEYAIGEAAKRKAAQRAGSGSPPKPVPGRAHFVSIDDTEEPRGTRSCRRGGGG